MKDQIHILCYLSTVELADELVGKLSRGGQECWMTLLGEEKPLTKDRLRNDYFINALLVRQEDIESLNGYDWGFFPKQNTFSKDKGLSVLFCVNCTDIPISLSEIFVVVEVKDSAEVIRNELMQLHHKLFQKIKGRYGDFVGRNSEIEQFQSVLYSEKATRTSTVVVSGRPGVGREAFVRECIRQAKGQRDYEPHILSVGRNSNIELFLIQINSICRDYTEQSFKELLGKNTKEKTEAAIRMLNSLFEQDKYLILYDDGQSCVRYNRMLSDWFKFIVTDPMLMGGMHLYVISNISVSYSRIRTDEDVAYITLYGMSLSDRKKLLYKHLSEQEEAISEADIHYLAESLVYSPNQLIKVVEDIKTKGIVNVKKNINIYQKVGDKKILTLIKSYDSPEHQEAWNLLVLLSRIEYVGKTILKSIYGDRMPEVEKEIDCFMADGIVERFGEWLGLIRLDSSVSDYIRRNKISYSEKSIQLEVTDALAKLVEGQHLITEDYSTYLFKVKRGVEQGRFNEESYLVPSVLVNTISEAYDGRNWKPTISLCEDVLNRRTNYFQEVYREIRYWYCLALAREKKDEQFQNQVQYFKGADLYFLRGFYFRIKKEYALAEAEYQKALNISPGMSRAKREMVLVLQAQQKFTAALEMAKINYEREPENAYQIHAYFRCLVRKRDILHEERDLLIQFMTDKEKFFKSKFYTEGMKFEYDRFINRITPDILIPEANNLRKKYPYAVYINDIVNDYLVSQGFESHIKPNDFAEDFNL